MVDPGRPAPPVLCVLATPDNAPTVIGAWHLLTARRRVDHALHVIVVGASIAAQQRVVAYAQRLGLAGLVVATDRDPAPTGGTDVELDLRAPPLDDLVPTELAQVLAHVTAEGVPDSLFRVR